MRRVGSNEAIDILSAPINISSSGNNTIVSAVAGKKIIVLGYVTVCAGAVSVRWQSSGGTILDGPCAFAANGGAAPPMAECGHFETVAGEGLVINLGGAVQVGGHVVYGLVNTGGTQA